MSQLREQLQSAARAHQAIRYPGNLAGDVLGQFHAEEQQRNRMRIFPWALTAIAAAVLISLVSYKLYPLLKSATSTLPGEEDQATLSLAIPAVDHSMPVKPEMPSGIDMVPTYQALSFPTSPGFPSLDSLKDENEQNPSNSKESVL